MAPRKNAKKQPEAPNVNIGAEIFASLRELEKIKGIPVEYMVERLKQALTNAYRKDREDHRDIPGENVVVNITETGLTMHQIKTVVDIDALEEAGEIIDLALQIPVDAARRSNPNLNVGDTVYYTESTSMNNFFGMMGGMSGMPDMSGGFPGGSGGFPGGSGGFPGGSSGGFPGGGSGGFPGGSGSSGGRGQGGRS